MRKTAKLLLVLALMLNLFSCSNAFALQDVQIAMVPDKTSCTGDEEVNLSFMFSCPENINVASFRVRILFDSSKFVYKGLYSQYSSSNFKTSVVGNSLTLIYLTDERGVNLAANTATSFFELNFKAISDGSVGNAVFSAAADGICNYDCVPLPSSYIDSVGVAKVATEPANCNLASLQPIGCILSPNFSPETTNYVVDVAYSKSTIEFAATPEDPDATVKVSRKTLNSSGKSTDISITVTSSDKKSKKVYSVTVNRGTKVSSSANSDKSSKSKGSSSSNSASSKSGSSSKSNNGTSSSSDAKESASLVVKESNFNFALFFIVSAVCVTVAVLIIKGKKKKASSKNKKQPK